MPEQVTRLRVFVASPSDVADERDRLAREIERLNRTLGQDAKVVLELVRWANAIACHMIAAPKRSAEGKRWRRSPISRARVQHPSKVSVNRVFSIDPEKSCTVDTATNAAKRPPLRRRRR